MTQESLPFHFTAVRGLVRRSYRRRAIYQLSIGGLLDGGWPRHGNARGAWLTRGVTRRYDASLFRALAGRRNRGRLLPF
jgi:hypothetical protein